VNEFGGNSGKENKHRSKNNPFSLMRFVSLQTDFKIRRESKRRNYNAGYGISTGIGNNDGFYSHFFHNRNSLIPDRYRFIHCFHKHDYDDDYDII